MIISPAWNSWMGDLVNEKERGIYFGRRNRITGLILFFSLLIAGFILQRFADGITTQYTGFIIIFGIALFSRILSFLYLTKKYEPPYTIVPEAQFSFIDFLKQARFRNFGLFVLYLCFMNLAVFFSAPFFTAYMLYDLKLDYMTFTVITATAIIIKYLSMPVWGRSSDKYGAKKILTLTGFLMPLIPVLWLFSKNNLYLILIQMYSGFVWAGFEISSFNFVFDTTTPAKRATCVAYYNVLNGVAIFIGAVIGGIIVKYNNVFWSKYLFVFLLSGILRYAASFAFIPKIREVRSVEHIPYHQLFFHIITTMPTSGLIYNMVVFIKKKKKVKPINKLINIKSKLKK
jgi:MFS family permease